MSGEPYDEKYWGPGGIDISRWGHGQVARGMPYKSTGAASVAFDAHLAEVAAPAGGKP